MEEDGRVYSYPAPRLRTNAEKDAWFNFELDKALNSMCIDPLMEVFEVPKGLTREQKRAFIVSKVGLE